MAVTRTYHFRKGNTMTDEQKKERKSNNGEGWYIMSKFFNEEKVESWVNEDGPFKTLHEAEKALKADAAEQDGKEIAITKVQRRIKIRVETVKMVKFE